MLFPVSLPSRGGDTQYVNMHEVYDGLPAATRAVSDQIAPRSPPPKPSPSKGEGLYQHSCLYSRPLDGGGSGWG
jgi:alpha-ketoglutarate-dependent taurine dioxygenase